MCNGRSGGERRWKTETKGGELSGVLGGGSRCTFDRKAGLETGGSRTRGCRRKIVVGEIRLTLLLREGRLNFREKEAKSVQRQSRSKRQRRGGRGEKTDAKVLPWAGGAWGVNH